MDKIKIRFDTKILILVCLITLFIYVAYWTSASYNNFFGFITGSDPDAVEYVSFLGIVFWVGHIGLTARIIGVFLGMLSMILLASKSQSFSRIKILVFLALILESIYFVSYIPNTPYLWREEFTGTFYLGLGYFLQFLLVTPFLAMLAYKTIKYKQTLADQSFWKWAGISFVTYTSALWVNAMFRWFDMGNISIDFLNSAVFMTLAIVFSILAARSLSKVESKAAKWIGIALMMIGLHYSVYLVSSYFIGMLNFVLLADIWTIPLLILGISLFFGKSAYFKDKKTT